MQVLARPLINPYLTPIKQLSGIKVGRKIQQKENREGFALCAMATEIAMAAETEGMFQHGGLMLQSLNLKLLVI